MSLATSRTFCSPPNARGAWSSTSPAANGAGCCWRKLFTKPSNLLVLDEPTNDLDVETLELLESLLVEYQGTVLLVSHDRAFLNDVVTSTLAIEPDGQVKEYDGGYDDYLRQRSAQPIAEAKAPTNATSAPAVPPREKAKKLSFKERQRTRIAAGSHRDARDGDPPVARGNGRSDLLQARRCGDRADEVPGWPISSRSWRTFMRGGRFWKGPRIE